MEVLKSLVDFILHIDKHLETIISQYHALTYLILFVIIFAETGFGYGYTFPINKRLLPWLRLDHLYAGKALRPLRTQVLAIPASDHAGLVVDLALR